MGFSKWSLEKVQFLLSHIEDFVEDDGSEIRRQMMQFQPETGLEKLDALSSGSNPSDPDIPLGVFQKLSPFYEAGFLAKKEGLDWKMTDLFCKGQVFHLNPDDQIPASKMVQEISPLQVHKGSAVELMKEMNLKFFNFPRTAQCYLFKPTSNVAYVLVTDLPVLWSEDHIASTQRLLNKSFLL